MDREKRVNPHPQRKKWVTTLATQIYAEARAKADAVKGSKIRHRPNGTFEVRVGTEVKAEAAPEESVQAE
jgi:hypothetical protein